MPLQRDDLTIDERRVRLHHHLGLPPSFLRLVLLFQHLLRVQRRVKPHRLLPSRLLLHLIMMLLLPYLITMLLLPSRLLLHLIMMLLLSRPLLLLPCLLRPLFLLPCLLRPLSHLFCRAC
jgi:hypothetical protein